MPSQRFPGGNAAFTLIQLLVVVTVIGIVALPAPSVQAGTVSAQLDDLILGFRASGGTGGGVNLEVDLGSVSNFYNAAPGSVIPLPELASQDLIDTYGADWATRTDLFWGAAATDGNALPDPNGKPVSTLWATSVPGNTPPLEGNSGNQAGAATKIFGIYNGSAGSLNGSTSTSNSSAAAAIQNTQLGSWSSQEGTSKSFGFFGPKIDGEVPSQGALNLYELQPAPFPPPPGTFLGALTLTQNGLSFQAAAVVSPPVAAFSGTPTSGTAPLMVTFTNTSTGSFSSEAWDFGDGGTSSASNPSHTYTSPGVYPVALTVFGPGGSNTLTQAGYITVTAPELPVAAFTGSPTNGTAPLLVAFINSSTGSITNQAWDFGDGTTDNAASPSHTYTSPGAYTVALTVFGPGGSNTLTQAGYIVVGGTVVPPVAAFTGSPTNGVAPLMVTFVNSSTGTITNQAWDFGDGGTSGLASPSHIYNSPGVYTVALTVFGPAGSNTLTQVGYIVVGMAAPPMAGFSGSPTNGVAPLLVSFVDNSTGTITNRLWAFGDGGTSSASSPVHTYTNAGVFSVSLLVVGPGGSNTSTQVGYIVVGTAPPVAGFTGSPTNGVAPLTVNFADASTGAVTNRMWSFGDGGTSTLTSPVHTYTNADVFSVSLLVIGPGGSNTLNRAGLITITSTNTPPNTNAPALMIVTPSNYQTFTTNGITVTGTASDTNGIKSVVVNGAPANLLGTNWFTDVTLVPGTNTFTVIATDNSFAHNTATQVVHAVLSSSGSSSNTGPITVSAPAVTNALLCLTNTCIVVAGETNVFIVEAKDLNGNPLTYQWFFGDGAISDPSPLNTAQHAYVATNCGPYSASVTVSDGVSSTNAGLTVSVPCAMDVSSLKLRAKFTKVGSDGCTIKGTLAGLPEGFSIANAAVSLDVGGATVDIQLNAKGSGATRNASVKLSRNKKTGVWTITGKLKGDLKESWATYGITSGTVINSAVTFPVLLMIQSDTLETFHAELPLSYSNKSGASGTATLLP
jgi:PKD repeat protein